MNSNEYFLISCCRICSSEALQPIVSLGRQKIVDFVSNLLDATKPIIPLELVKCSNCHLVQLRHTTNPDILFKEFWYRSGINEQMRAALLDIVMKSVHLSKISKGDAVCDIGCNDGTMLSLYPSEYITVGFDPSNQLATAEAKNRMNYAINNYFNKDEAQAVVSYIGQKFKVITAVAMFYDIPDPAEFLMDIKSVLADDGLLVIQMNYLLTMLKNNAFDNICHEHIMYYSLTSLRWLLNRCGLEVIDVETNEINGGSFRAYIRKTPIKRDDVSPMGFENVKQMMDEEREFKLDKINPYYEFGSRVTSILEQLTKYIVKLVASGKVVYAYGASTRGTVLLNATPVPLPLAGVAERDENKFGKYMVSGWLKIHPEEYVRERCKYMLVLPWHFKESIVNRERQWIENGGTLIFPLSTPYILNKDGEKTLQQLQEEEAKIS